MQIGTVTADELPQVVELWKPDRQTLGFFPQGAFETYAENGNIRIAKDESGRVLGYAAFRETKNWIRLAHLCVDRSIRGAGLAKGLIQDLKETARKRDCFGISLKCRRDYDIHKFWPKVGFTARNESEGRGKERKPLTLFTWESGVPDLFSEAIQAEDSRLSVVMDTNIFIDIFGDGEQVAAEESRALDEPWLSDSIALSIVNEVFNEINRIEDESDRSSLTIKARSVEERQHDEEKAKQLFPIVREILNWDTLTPSRESDIHQLSRAAASDCDVFVTRDGEMLNKAEKLLEACDLLVQRPVELISLLDQSERAASYSPASLSGTTISDRQISSSDIVRIADIFLSYQNGEKRNQFRERLLVEASRVRSGHSGISKLVEDDAGNPVLFYTHRIDGDTARVEFLRSTTSRFAPTVIRSVLLRLISNAATSKAKCIVISDTNYSTEVHEALVELEFYWDDQVYIRKIGYGVLDIRNFDDQKLKDLGPFPEGITDGEHAIELAQHIEKTRWPVKTVGADLKSVLIPIKPHWAGKLFHSTIAEQELFRPSPILALNRENVYYSKSISAPLEYQARVLWYTTCDKKILGSGEICGCSRLIRSHRMKAKEAFKAFNRLGVYDWNDVLALVKGDPEATVTAYHFADTEIFEAPVKLDEARAIDAGGMIAGPSILTESQFLEIYKRGFNLL
ncbi:GNAT family N-acetyltransferase [Pelagicoccus sp. SDUM812002]|uniref:GNAT family N-acetyltransferase n=1 Tax=Pelagicoccus sp. SDUM812002 TaxID=3041266 RepID=UPI00281249B0|nr:GNAT family N-acetyltransferase [Pelagicoccus sp. SDUM812002]